jgi:hypothetical protein
MRCQSIISEENTQKNSGRIIKLFLFSTGFEVGFCSFFSFLSWLPFLADLLWIAVPHFHKIFVYHSSVTSLLPKETKCALFFKGLRFSVKLIS